LAGYALHTTLCLQTKGDAVVFLASDFQDPPDLILNFIKKWEEGYSIVVGIKNQSKENPLCLRPANFSIKHYPVHLMGSLQ